MRTIRTTILALALAAAPGIAFAACAGHQSADQGGQSVATDQSKPDGQQASKPAQE